MVLRADKISERDFYKALETIKNKMGKTHADRLENTAGEEVQSSVETSQRRTDKESSF